MHTKLHLLDKHGRAVHETTRGGFLQYLIPALSGLLGALPTIKDWIQGNGIHGIHHDGVVYPIHRPINKKTLMNLLPLLGSEGHGIGFGTHKMKHHHKKGHGVGFGAVGFGMHHMGSPVQFGEIAYPEGGRIKHHHKKTHHKKGGFAVDQSMTGKESGFGPQHGKMFPVMHY